ncbi:hypothetical protein [Actinacidiphila rubida]|uniref:Uncharacterized protein n=1 Tax=Actinacidiphila rubida TaxID=310780 RepID=A0A1H8PZ56_9ACTN|nr:hypothetical protein [Actinacidiphila rubida]SEO47086.1 hypothetical protein SAMN05216267_102788 [Actinacidiphila rubida]
MSLPRVRTTLTALTMTFAACAGVLSAGAPAAAARPAGTASRSVLAPFREPDFAATCAWHTFGEGEQPPLWLMFVNPLCVEYSKRDITFDDGGALTFLLAEPSRFAIALPTCRYYQKDHWSVQTTSGATPLVAWDGQYWWDKSGGHAGARLANFRIDGRTVGIGDAALALRDSGFPHVADALDAYGQAPGETGGTVDLPFDLTCALAG